MATAKVLREYVLPTLKVKFTFEWIFLLYHARKGRLISSYGGDICEQHWEESATNSVTACCTSVNFVVLIIYMHVS